MGAVVVHSRASIQNKKAPAAYAVGAVLFRSLTMTYSHMGNATLRSVSLLSSGWDGSRPLWSSGKTVDHWVDEMERSDVDFVALSAIVLGVI